MQRQTEDNLEAAAIIALLGLCAGSYAINSIVGVYVSVVLGGLIVMILRR